MSETYIISNIALPPEQRNRFRALRHAETYRNLKTREPDAGERGVYTVELTPSEVRGLQQDRPSNLRHLEKVLPGSRPHVDATIPSDRDLRGSKADMLYEWGFTGRGIDVGVIDTGLGSGVAGKFSIKAIRGEKGLDPYVNSHGSKVASIAVPRKSRLVFSRAIDEEGQANYDSSDEISAIYWMTDEVGVHLINMSYGGISFSQTYQDALTHAKSKGVILLASAGNDSTSAPQYPANFDGVIVVGSLDESRGWARAEHSNYGPWVDLWAKGVDVTAYGPDGSIDVVIGTSVATPLVTFVKASLLTKGLTSIGQIKTSDATRAGGDDAPSGVGGGKRLNGENGAWKMRDFCS
jgi:hypothetical protein